MTIDPEEDEPWLDDEKEDEPERDMPHGRRFGEGQPRGRGRPPGSPNRKTILTRVARQRHRIRIDGKWRRVSSVELVLHTIMIEASRGNLRAIDLQEGLQSKYAPRANHRRVSVLVSVSKIEWPEWEGLYGWPRRSAEEVLQEFPHLRHMVNRRGSAFDQPAPD